MISPLTQVAVTALASRHDSDREPHQPLAIRITEVSAVDYPADSHEYRGLIRSHNHAGIMLLDQTLQTRRKPEWLVNVRHQGPGFVHFSLQSRRSDTQPWQDIGRVTLHPQTHLNGQSSAVVDLQLRGWDEVPQMSIRVRLSVDQADEQPEPPRPAGMGRPRELETAPVHPGKPARNLTRVADEGTVSDGDPKELPQLTAPEQVIVKDIWNKFLAFQDMLVEMFFERLLHEEPELLNRFGDAVDLVPAYFAEMFDVSVRALKPQTEQTLRESYRGIYPAPLGGYKTVPEYAGLLADLGMRPNHWLTARRVWVWVLSQIPYLEEYDRENLDKGIHSATYRFFTLSILAPAVDAANQYTEALTPEMIREMRRCGEIMASDALAAGIDFYRILFQQHPDVLPYFGRTDVDSLASHLMQTVAFLVRSLEAGRDVILELRELSRIHAVVNIPPDAYPKIAIPMLTVMKQRVPDFTLELEHAWGILLNRVINVLKQPMLNQERILAQANQFIELVAKELEWEPADFERRRDEVQREIKATGTYTHTYEELAYGAQVAWRNSGKCIGRIAWRNMIVRDLRHVTDPDEMFRESVEHLRMGTNGGNMQIVMNVFRPKKPMERWGPRIWNAQYVRYAAYEQADGSILGDRGNLALTQALLRLGWTPPAEKTAFDNLPLVIDVPGHAPKMYEIPPDDILTVAIEHPLYPELDAMGLRWCAIPAISNFRMEVGGIQYGCIPFNGWFMETEIARNLWEDGRYGQAEAIARAMGLDTSSEQTLWRDRAFLELNVAVLHSFSRSRVTLVDHQTASRQFLSHDLREKRAGRECPAQWSWVVPSAGGSTTPVWHHEMRDFLLSPSYHYAADKWAVIDAEVVIAGEEAIAEETRGDRLLILYGSETGTAEGYARQAARRLSRHRPQIMALDEFDPAELGKESLVLVVTSTFGEGSLPGNARAFHARLLELGTNAFDKLRFSVMALGSTVYPQFCAAGAELDRELARVGGKRVVAMHRGDEIKGQSDTFRQWLDLVARLLGEDPTSTNASAEAELRVSFLPLSEVTEATRAASQLRRPGVEVPVVANRELLKEVIVGSRSTRFMAFDISQTGLTYETGDHVAIYPHNPSVLVQRLCDRLNIDSSAWFITSLTDYTGTQLPATKAYPEPVSVWQVLTEELDLSLREPYNELINSLLLTADAPSDKERLDVWASTFNRGDQDESCRALKKYMADNFLTVVDLLDAFPSATISFAQLIDLLPKQKPRFYSISSCSLVHPGQIHATVGVIQITTDAGQTRPGLCSNYLAGLDPDDGATVRLAVRTSNFRPPRDPKAPMLMVGPGTGLSPLVGFLQHREVQLRALRDAHTVTGQGITDVPVELGHARLYFGCRNLNDYLYQQELESWRDAGVLTHLDVAFSRLGEETLYVQHLIGRHSEDLWAVLSQPDCHYYVCGDAKMADDVFEVLMNIAKTVGGLSHAQAVEFFRTMQRENRFVMDVWGVLLNFRKSLADVQEARYSQGERWLERLTPNEAAL